MYINRTQVLLYLFIILSIILMLTSLIADHLFFYPNSPIHPFTWIIIYTSFLSLLVGFLIVLTIFYKNKKNKDQNTSSVYDHHMKVEGLRDNGLDVTKAEDLERLKSEFISIVSHELRTPLTSIYATLGLLNADKDLKGKSKELVEVAYRNTKRLNVIINDILDLDNLDLGKFDIKNEPVVLEQVIRETLRLYQHFEEEYKVAFVEENMLMNVKVNADPQKLHQVIANILSNAAKFSKINGKIYISMENLGDQVRVLIRDEGEGIPEDYHNKIFTRFYRIDVSDARRTKGAGLGLIICKKIIKQLGGEVGFTSKPKQGSTFYFDLPQIK